MFKLKAPCRDCPFRNDKPHLNGWLGAERARDIYQNLITGGFFPCHKTVNHDEYEDDQYDEDGNEVEKPFKIQEQNQFCAGALIMLEKSGELHKSDSLQVMERLRHYKKAEMQIDDSPIFNTSQEFIDWHE